MAKIISVANLKGGVGKSTITVNVAGALQAKRLHVVVIDADEQGTAAGWASAGKLPFAVEHMPLEGARDGRRWIDRALSIEADYLLVDCPPHVGSATETAVGLSDAVLIPVFSGLADLRATETAIDLVRRARHARHDPRALPHCLLIPSRIDRRTLAGREIESALKRFEEPVGPAIHQRAAFIDACTAGLTISQYAPGSQADEEIVELTAVIKRRLKP